MNKETNTRSILKTVSWRLIATTTTFILALIFFKDDKDVLTKSGLVASSELVIKILIYYLHERVWSKIRWGYAE